MMYRFAGVSLVLTLLLLLSCEDSTLDLSCPDAVRLTPHDSDVFSGIEYCPSRKTARRVEAVECEEVTILEEWYCNVTEDYNDCNQDSDCAEGKNPGVCLNGDEGCRCAYPCRKDEGCRDDQLCPCEAYHVDGRSEAVTMEGSFCIPANCRTGADCPGGECAGTPGQCNCGGDSNIYGFYCRYPEDNCASAADCNAGDTCLACSGWPDGVWHCAETYSCD